MVYAGTRVHIFYFLKNLIFNFSAKFKPLYLCGFLRAYLRGVFVEFVAW